MSIEKQVLRRWIESISDNQEIAIDDGGLTLIVVDNPKIYLEVGGIPEDTEEN
jgi:hypothetical protein